MCMYSSLEHQLFVVCLPLVTVCSVSVKPFLLPELISYHMPHPVLFRLPNTLLTDQMHISPRFNKIDQGNLLIKEYKRLGSVLDSKKLVQLVRDVEVELSKNSTFRVMTLSHLHAAHPLTWAFCCQIFSSSPGGSSIQMVRQVWGGGWKQSFVQQHLDLLKHTVTKSQWRVCSAAAKNTLGDGAMMLECRNVVKPLPAPFKGCTWEVKYAKGHWGYKSPCPC